jgi:hypothetical protein
MKEHKFIKESGTVTDKYPTLQDDYIKSLATPLHFNKLNKVESFLKR